MKDYLTPNVGGNHSTDDYSLLYENLDAPEGHDNFDPPEILSGREFTKFNQELKLRKMIEQNPVKQVDHHQESSIPRIQPFNSSEKTNSRKQKQYSSQKLSPRELV